MRRVFTWLAGAFQALVAWVLPFREAARTGRQRSGHALWWILHALIVLLVIVLLFFLNNEWLKIAPIIPRAPLLRKSWLPILFMLLYMLGWLVVLLWRVLSSDEKELFFPDIEKAWNEALDILARENVQLTDLPLFLILGQPEEGGRTLFGGTQLTVPQAPPRPDAPLHVYAAKDAVYVTCAGASRMGLHAKLLAGKISLTGQAGATAGNDAAGSNVEMTLVPGQASQAVANIHAIRVQADKEQRPLTEFEMRTISSHARRDNPNGSLLKHPAQLEEQGERLKYLCRLIVQARSPYCPVNGLLLLLPFEGTGDSQEATDTGDIFRRDLETVRAALRVLCPMFALLCDIQVIPGYADFIEHFSNQERRSRIGQRCPLVPKFENGRDGALSAMVSSLAGWICRFVVPEWVYLKFQLEQENGADDFSTVTSQNTQLFLFANEIYERRPHLSTILTQALAEQSARPPLFGGCYIAGTGRDAIRQQAFTVAMLRRLVEEQSCVQWTPETRAEEEQLRQLTVAGWSVLGAVVLVGLSGFLYYLLAR